MKQMFLISDPDGLSLRGTAPATAAECVMITPSDKPHPHARSIEWPEEWLPDFDPSMAYGRRCWWVCDRIFALAVPQLELDADFFWCIESDVVAKPEVWQRLIEAGGKRALDGIHAHLKTRADFPDNPWFGHSTTPQWATHHCLGAVHRFSRRTLEWLASSAPANRNTFCEVHAPSVIRANGGSLGDLKQLGWFYNPQSLNANPERQGTNTGLLNHPVKKNTLYPVKHVV